MLKNHIQSKSAVVVSVVKAQLSARSYPITFVSDEQPHMMGVCEELRQAFNNCDVAEILRLLHLEGTGKEHVSFLDEAHGLQSLLMRLCHLHISPEERASAADALLDTHSVDVNVVDVAGRTALCHACIAERTDMIHALARDDLCDPNRADKDGNTPLIYAVKSRRTEVVETLIDCFLHRGLNVNHCNKKGMEIPTF